MLPPALARALERVKQNADYMPAKQLNEVLGGELGSAWRFRFKEFHDKPIAAASIGQVHKAVLMDGTVVAVKVQYPGVAQSIGSDLANLKTLVTMTNLVPRGLFIDEIMRVASEELAEECDYLKEAAHQSRYRGLIESDPILRKHTSVPRIYEALTTSSVITSDFVQGVSIEKAIELPQSVRNAIARTMLVLAMKELFEWRLVQSDPNFANYLYDVSPRTALHCTALSRSYNCIYSLAPEEDYSLHRLRGDSHVLEGVRGWVPGDRVGGR
jgi:aarF domain-containing kinase